MRNHEAANANIVEFASGSENRYPDGYPCDADLMQLADELKRHFNADELRRLVELLIANLTNEKNDSIDI